MHVLIVYLNLCSLLSLMHYIRKSCLTGLFVTAIPFYAAFCVLVFFSKSKSHFYGFFLFVQSNPLGFV